MKKLLIIMSACTPLLLSLCSCSKEEPEPISIPDDFVEMPADESSVLPVNSTELDTEVIKPILDYLEGFNTNNPELVADSITPQVIIDAIKETEQYEDYIAMMQSDIDRTYSDMWIPEYGENAGIEFVNEVSNSTLPENVLENAEKYFEYEYYDLEKEVEIEEGFEITYNYKLYGDDNSKETEEVTCLVKVKDDGWKAVFCAASTLDYYSDMPEASEMRATEEASETTEPDESTE